MPSAELRDLTHAFWKDRIFNLTTNKIIERCKTMTKECMKEQFKSRKFQRKTSLEILKSKNFQKMCWPDPTYYSQAQNSHNSFTSS